MLAVARIQSTDYREGSVTARLHAEGAVRARQRVEYALGESFTVGPARHELPPPV
jgi:hypothetical protein